MPFFQVKLTFISKVLLILMNIQYLSTNVYNEDETNVLPKNREIDSNERCEDECGLNSRGMSTRNFLTDPKRKWPDATIPHAIHNFTKSEEQLVFQAMNEIQKVSCVRFVESPSYTRDILYIVYCATCSASHKGKSTEIQFLTLKTCILRKFSIVHELMHIMGIAHEHERYDRDDYITIHWENMKERDKNNFGKSDNISFTTLKFPYDYDSVMHYPAKAYSKNGQDTITALKNVNNYLLGQRDHLSKYDILKINALYNCNDDC